MKVIVGDETGIIKYIDVSTKKLLSTWGSESQARNRGVLQLAYAGLEKNKESHVAAALNNQTVEIWDCEDIEAVKPMLIFPFPDSKSNFVGLNILREKGERKVVVINENGDVYITKWDSPKNITTFNIGGPLTKAIFSGSIVAVGGKERDLSLHDLTDPAGKAVWKAKNVPHNFLDMQVPVWIKDLTFLQPFNNGSAKLATCTSYAQVRIYDIKVQRRPVLSIEGIFGEDKHPLTAIHCTSDKNIIIVGDAIGTMTKVDIRTSKPFGSFKGIGGGIRGLACHHEFPFVATVGLDRALRVYNSDTRVMTDRMYLKQRLNCCLVSSTAVKVDVSNLTASETTALTAKDDDDMWTVLDKRSHSLGMDGSAQKSLPKKVEVPKQVPTNFCSYNETGASRSEQQFYVCFDCKMDAVCGGCIEVCHKGHKVKKDLGLDMGYCDCGSISKKCKGLRAPVGLMTAAATTNNKDRKKDKKKVVVKEDVDEEDEEEGEGEDDEEEDDDDEDNNDEGLEGEIEIGEVDDDDDDDDGEMDKIEFEEHDVEAEEAAAQEEEEVVEEEKVVIIKGSDKKRKLENKKDEKTVKKRK